MLAPISTSRRSQRSSSAPANGPSSEYGRYSTANAPAIAHGVAARSGLNRMAPARPAWNSPSPNWLTARSSSSRRNSGSARTDRHNGDGRAGVGHGVHVLLAGSAASAGKLRDPTHSTNIRRAALVRHHRRSGGAMMVRWRTQRTRRISVAPAAHRVRAGTLLLANTDLLEPTFRRSVIYIVEHNDGGTLGVVLNRPSETAVYNVLPQWAKLATKPKTMFIGGPVKRDAALCLATLRVGIDPTGVPGLRHVQGRMVMVDLDADPDTIAPMVEGVRIFAGYSGWTIGQLEGEIERDDWIVLSALPSDVLVEPRVDLWARVLRRQPLPLSLLATHPIDVSRN